MSQKMEFSKITLVLMCIAISLSPTNSERRGCSLETAAPKFQRAVFDFTTKLLTRVADEEQNDFVFSPLSVWTLLASVAEGAQNKTHEELRQVLQLHRQRCFNNKYYELLKGCSIKNDQLTFQRGGAIVADENLLLKKQFINYVRGLDVSQVMDLDFSDTNAAARQVNDYISQATGGIIQEAVDPDVFEEAVMMLIDCVYFKGNWQVPFNPSETKLAPFHNEDSQEIGQVNLMYRSGKFNLTNMENLNAKVLELPYGTDGRFSMLVFLPHHYEVLTNVISNLRYCTINSIFKKFSSKLPEDVHVSLPRFKLASELDTLKDLVGDLGITRIFDESMAELGGIADESLYVSKILQKAEIEVTEEGTVGSAFTEAGFSWRQVNDDFLVDKPFLFLVVERPTQIIIFAGAYSTPSVY